MIKQTITAGMLFCFIIPIEGKCGKVNLTKEAEDFISRNGEGVEILSFTDGHGHTDGFPVKVTVGTMLYENGCQHTNSFDYTKCKDLFMWYIYCSLFTPFNLTINVTLPYKGEENHTLTFNLNNATTAEWNPQNLTKEEYNAGPTEGKNCNFTVETAFKGNFYYQLQRSRGDFPKKDSLGVGLLRKPNVGLSMRSLTELTYNISGIFKHEVVCPKVSKKMSNKGSKSSKKNGIRKST